MAPRRRNADRTFEPGGPLDAASIRRGYPPTWFAGYPLGVAAVS